MEIKNNKESIVKDNTVAFLTGHYIPSLQPHFVVIPEPYAERTDMYIQENVLIAFTKMAEAAYHDGVTFCILSATRNFDYQLEIWENKWNGLYPLFNNIKANEAYPDSMLRAKKILDYSAMPGTSRHHWGTDIDLNALENEYFETEIGLNVFNWLLKNASRFGFYQTYTKLNEQRPKGYREEKWHWTYLPISIKYTRLAAAHLKNSDIKGFSGDDFVEALQIKEHYILGINRACK